jgi:Na+/melibiose symporter-like transporter
VIIEEQKKADGQGFTFDTAGAISLFGWLSCLLLFLSFGYKWGLTAFPSLLLAALTISFFAAFLIAEKRSTEPIVKLSIFKNRLFAAAVLSSMASTVGSSSAVFLVPFYLVQGLGFSGTMVGTFMALLAVPPLVLSPLSGRLSDRMGSRFLSSMGVAVVCAGLVWLIRLSTGATPLRMAVGIILVGSGVGIFHPPNNSAIVGSVPREMLGVASAIGTTARHIGSSISLAVTGAVYSAHQYLYLSRFSHMGFAPGEARRMASVESFGNTLLVALSVACVGFMASLFRGSAGSRAASG